MLTEQFFHKLGLGVYDRLNVHPRVQLSFFQNDFSSLLIFAQLVAHTAVLPC